VGVALLSLLESAEVVLGVRPNPNPSTIAKAMSPNSSTGRAATRLVSRSSTTIVAMRMAKAASSGVLDRCGLSSDPTKSPYKLSAQNRPVR